jgi:SynChlorMet cassette radical SAM/SPASM protein ScmE
VTDLELPRVASALRSVDIAITGRCNIKCKYCFYADEMAALNDLPTERWLSFFEELGELAVQRVCLTGGEVFTRPDLFELIDGIIANRMRYNLLSNGTLITEETLNKFETGKRRLRLDFIQISIDGSQAEIHNRSRPNSFDQALRGLRLLVKSGFPATVRVTVNRHNVDDLEAIARLLLEDVGLPGFSTNEAFPCGIMGRQAERVMLTPVQRQRAMQILAELTDRYDGRISANAGPLALAREFRRIEEAIADGETGLPGRGTLCGCNGVFNKIDVMHDGTFVPCHVLPTFHLGTIGKDSLRQTWLEHPLMDAVRRRRSIPLQTLETCCDCPYLGFCTGGCPGIAFFLTGELNGRNPMDCYRVHRGEDPRYALENK